jgi:PAS domain S-box-containing protein
VRRSEARVSPELLAELLEQLSRLEDFAEACSTVLDRTFAASEYGRALVVVNVGGELRGAAWGVPAGTLDGLLATRETAAALRETLENSGGPRFLPVGSFPHLDFEGYMAVPFHGTDRERAFGIVLLEGPADEARGWLVAEIFERCGASLQRIAELVRAGVRAGAFDRRVELLNEVVNSLVDPVLLTNANDEIILANRRADQLLTPAEGDSEGRRRALQINNLLLSSFLTQSTINGGARGSGSRELNLVDAVEGTDLLFEVLSVPFGAAAEGGVILVLRDITDLKRAVGEMEAQFSRSRVAEHQARQERDRLNVILENVSDPILVTDEHSNLVLMNPEAERLFVARADVAAGRRRLIHANDTKFSTLISNFLLRDDQRQFHRLSIGDPDDLTAFPAEVVSSKILNSRGEPTAIVSVVHDLTQAEENERLARELQQLNDQLEERIRRATVELEQRNQQLEWQSEELQKASRLKSEFLANMSHELRTPINVILGYTSLMRERIYGELTRQQDEALAKVYTTSQHLLELINDILDLSKIEAGKMPVHREPVPIGSLIAELAETVSPMLRSKGLEYRADMPADLPIISTDRTKLKQVLLNLLSNAIKFTQHGSITVQAEALERAGGRDVRIAVRDTGIGIRPENLATIFDDFRQIDQSHTREYGGTGLGLSITRKLLELLGGSIHVESTFGSGSSFIVELPCGPRRSVTPGAESAPAPGG